ncbi:MAG: pterin-4-alpha-carbinolamine dehydratase [Pseudomonadota bacterium]|jgi:4a-hydroxytetrahydrobiopterin dehydratase
MSNLTAKRCSQCQPGTPALTEEERTTLGREVPEWKIIEGTKLHREYKFKTYMDGVAWVQVAGEISDSEDHHPDIHIFYRRVVLDLWTHTVNGLSENDYILAAKLDQSYNSFPGKR